MCVVSYVTSVCVTIPAGLVMVEVTGGFWPSQTVVGGGVLMGR